jgi:hypothetical protein
MIESSSILEDPEINVADLETKDVLLLASIRRQVRSEGKNVFLVLFIVLLDAVDYGFCCVSRRRRNGYLLGG